MSIEKSPRYPYLVRLSGWVSSLCSPPLVATLGMILTTAYVNRQPGIHSKLLHWEVFAFWLVMTAGLPSLYVIWLMRKKVVTNFHLNVREQRTKPLLFGLLGMSLSVLLCLVLPVHRTLQATLIANLALAILFIIITLYWKISGHCATIASFVTLLYFLYGFTSLPIFALIPLVGWARVYRGRHTLAQVIAGTLLGLSIYPILRWW